MALEENTVEPISKPIKRTGRATSTPRRYALIGIAVGAAQRLEWCGLSTAQANKAVAAELRALGIKPTRGKGGVTAGTLRRWREQASEVQPLVRSLPETVLTKLSAVDLGWISASVNAESMTTEKWRTRISALAPAEARRFVLHALERSIVQMILADPPNPPLSAARRSPHSLVTGCQRAPEHDGDDMGDEDLLRQREYAEIRKCSERTIERERGNGTGCRYIKIGRAVRYRRHDILAFIERHARRSTSEPVR